MSQLPSASSRPDRASVRESFGPGLDAWLARLPSPPLSEAIAKPESTAVFAVDVVEGIEPGGQLSTPALASIVDPIVDLFVRADEMAVRHFLLIQDKHGLDDLDYSSYMHVYRSGKPQSNTISALTSLPFADRFTIVPTHSIHPAIGTGLSLWLAEHLAVRTVIVVGAGTDLGVYQTAMHLRHRANAMNLSGFRVVIPANCVAAHHHSALSSLDMERPPFPDDVVQQIFLYHMALNGIEVIGRFT
jgi:nicotinamidase-related amidase